MRKLLILIVALALYACKNTNEAPTLSKTVVQDTVITKPKPVMDTISQKDLEYITGRFDPKVHPDFVAIPRKYADRAGMYVRREVMDAFVKMYDAAAKEGIDMQIRSAMRNFDYQKGIWERKYSGQRDLSDGTNVAKDIQDPKEKCLKILEYSAMPSTSRHHWGTDIDINSFNNKYFESGKGKQLYDWMQANAASYGFCQPYTAFSKGRPFGYQEEKWHWSYLPLSKPLTKLAQKHLNDSMIQGFSGAETATDIGVVEKYVLGINPDCK